MFGFSFTEIILLAAIGLIVLGPKQMQQLARVLGRTIGELKKAMNEVTSNIKVDLQEDRQSHAAKPDVKDAAAGNDKS